ncbi:MAG: 1-acyl-sn-glycerol-3-phosphate acyltransferase [Acetobacteraceae bacterium]|nr:1-acyl-sn-glycerol-3-phosphate acyltransferase [Acetobacteraceae bacterium]
MAGAVRALRRLLMAALWTVGAACVQSVLLSLPGHGKKTFARLYWAVLCRLLGFRVRVIGAEAADTAGRPVVYVSNHTSWLDIPVLGGQVEACFVAKNEVGKWPVIRTIAWLGRTVYVSRRVGSTVRERDEISARLQAGDNLMLFPEGTTSDGSRVLPFRSSLFSVAEGGARPLLQPISVAYDQLSWLPAGRFIRPLFAWYGDMDLASHSWRVAQFCGARATVLLHPPIDPDHFPDRKVLARTVWQVVADGAALLRQNRPAEPIVAENLSQASVEVADYAS